MNRTRVLLVSPNKDIVALCRKSFEKNDIPLQTVSGCDDALECLTEEFTGVVIIDSPVLNDEYPGFLKYVSESVQALVIVIGHENTPEEKITYLDAGAEIYINQPFNPVELAAQVKALLRKTGVVNQHPGIAEFAAGDFYIDYKRKLVTIHGEVVNLTSLEFSLLKELTLHAGKVLSHTHLLQSVWGTGYIEEKSFLYVYIGYLRRKLEPDPQNPRYIITYPGAGYTFHYEEKG